jgi:hypothetical protein
VRCRALATVSAVSLAVARSRPDGVLKFIPRSDVIRSEPGPMSHATAAVWFSIRCSAPMACCSPARGSPVSRMSENIPFRCNTSALRRWLSPVTSTSGSTPRHALIFDLGFWFAVQQARCLTRIKQGFRGLHGKARYRGRFARCWIERSREAITFLSVQSAKSLLNLC